LNGEVRADAIVVAAGRSARMGGIDKLATVVARKPLLAWALEAIAAAPEVERIALVTTPERREETAAAAWLPDRVVAVVPGGRRRQESVRAGFDALPGGDGGERVVIVHDGARPLVPPALVSDVARAAAEHGAAIPVLPLAETVKRIAGKHVVETVDRAGLASAQTPQGVRRSLLEDAWLAFPPDGEREFTDEAALLEACRIPVHAIPGRTANLKVTVPDDLARVSAALAGGSLRVGIGQDGHRFGPGRPLALGGLLFESAPRLHGHSDGDVVLHAVADALLGAASLGDLGRIFPADDRTPRGVASADLLREVVRRVAEAGFGPHSVDVTIVGARPRLAGSLDGMAATIARLLDVERAAVSVKASTGNLDGMEGAGRGISAHAVATLTVDR
jgi:2-C-methyl-D-erythritol 4-phosphate cytidylyltransferase/2-C-methyl-D-erythritol 2,4-cyclodiphosphate synthase